MQRMIMLLNLLLNILILNPANGQKTYTMSGYISDTLSGEELIGASVFILEKSTGTITNQYGFYSISLPEGKYSLRYSFLGYDSKSISITLLSNTVMNVQLVPAITELNACVIRAEEDSVQRFFISKMNSISINPNSIKTLPVIFGERDLLKTLQLLPGIQSAGDGNSGFYVRGGGLDQNLVLIDDAPVYNPAHLLGFFSVFNSDAIKDIQVYKGGIPSNYGGRLSSVIDVSMKNGDLNNYHASGGIGLVSSRLTVEGPLIKEKCSFIMAGRRTYGDLFLPLFNDPVVNSSRLYFYDLNFKVNYRVNANNRYYLSTYKGRDYFKYSDNFRYDWGNSIVSTKWNHIFNPSLFLNSTLVWSNYDYSIEFGQKDNGFTIHSGMSNIQIKEDFQYYYKPGRTYKFGFSSSWHTFPSTNIKANGISQVSGSNSNGTHAMENAVYFMSERKLNDHLSMETGMRISGFMVTGPGEKYIYNNEGMITDTNSYDFPEVYTSYFGLEPRLLLLWKIHPDISLKASVTRGNQYIHLLSNSTTTKPTDLWIPSSERVKPQSAMEYSLGISKNWSKPSVETSFELYYKDLSNQIEYKDGTDLILNPDIESQLVFGHGKACGAELLLRKNGNRLSGWIGYTLSQSIRKFDEIDNGDPFPARQDRTHDISVVGSYQFNPQWNISATWVYSTGNAVTFPSGKYYIGEQPVSLYTERNGYRMPAYHRMDFSIGWKIPCRNPDYKSNLELSVYNLYARENAFSIDFRQKENDPSQTEAVQLTLFKIIPSVSYNFNF